MNKLREEDIQLSMLLVTQQEEEGESLLSTMTTAESQPIQSTQITRLLDDYADVFAEPQGLPPFRKHHDYKIQLIEGANPVNVRPYRYAVQ